MGKFTVDNPVWIHDEGEEPETNRESGLEIHEYDDCDNEDIDAIPEENYNQELGEYDRIDINKLDLSNKEERILFFAIKNHGRDSLVVDDLISDYKIFEKKCPICRRFDSSNLEWCIDCDFTRLNEKEYFIDLLEDSYSPYIKRVKHIYSLLVGDRSYERKPKTIEL